MNLHLISVIAASPVYPCRPPASVFNRSPRKQPRTQSIVPPTHHRTNGYPPVLTIGQTMQHACSYQYQCQPPARGRTIWRFATINAVHFQATTVRGAGELEPLTAMPGTMLHIIFTAIPIHRMSVCRLPSTKRRTLNDPLVCPTARQPSRVTSIRSWSSRDRLTTSRSHHFASCDRNNLEAWMRGQLTPVRWAATGLVKGAFFAQPTRSRHQEPPYADSCRRRRNGVLASTIANGARTLNRNPYSTSNSTLFLACVLIPSIPVWVTCGAYTWRNIHMGLHSPSRQVRNIVSPRATFSVTLIRK